MGSQLMNSLLYMINYFHQVKDYNNVNYNNSTFPAGNYLELRPFMYINILWTIMPIITIVTLINKHQNLNNLNRYIFNRKITIFSVTIFT